VSADISDTPSPSFTHKWETINCSAIF